MSAEPDHLLPLDVVRVGDHLLVPDAFRPVAAVVLAAGGPDVVEWLTWPDALLPERAIEEAEAWATSTGVWIVYRSDDIDEVTRTAVFVRPDGIGGSVALGDRQPVGADDHGLWVGDPRDASAWNGLPVGDDDGAEEDDIGFSVADEESLDWIDAGPFWPDPSTWTESADHDPEPAVGRNADADEGEDDDADEDAGATTAGWSIEFGDPDLLADAAAAWNPPEPGRTGPTDVVRIAPDGSRSVVHVDHLVDGVWLDDAVLTLRFHRSGPRSDPDGWGVVYEPRTVRVDVSAGLPATVTTEALPSVAVVEATDDAWEREVGEREARRARWIDRLDLAGVAGSTWPRYDADAVWVERQVGRLRAQFVGLGRPDLVWTPAAGDTRRRRSDYRDVVVEVEGAGPDTALVVSFEHSAVPFLRLRRRYRVFAGTGRPLSWPSVTVHLEEDVASGHIPSRDDAVDGVLDI